MVAGRRMGRPWFPKLSALVVAVIFGATGASVVAQASPTTLNWGQVTTTQTPPGREFAAMTFDSVRNRTVLFGGGTAAFTTLGDTWEFDGANWVQRTPSTSAPALLAAAMAFDINRKVSVLFGGGTASFTFSSDTWEWDGTNWVLRTFTTAPSARLWTQMAYDSTRGRIVLFGGEGPGSTDLGDTWEYDGSTWTRKTPVNSPAPRFSSAMAFDPGLGRIVLFGGRSAGTRVADTWEWDGTNWTQFFPSSTPFVRFSHSLAYDPQVGHTVVFGGDHFEPYALGPTNDTWQWDGAQWTQDWTAATPIARADQSMALDANGRLVLFGGDNELNPPTLYTDTWELGTGITTPPGNPAAALNPASVDFGSVAVGSTSYVVAVTLFNNGTGPLLINSISITGDFAVSGTYCPIAPNPLAAGMVCRALLTFTPTAGGARFGNLVFSDNGPGGSQSVALHGIGVANDFSISANPTSVSVVQGSSVTSAISTAVVSGSAATVSLSATSPAGLTATLNPTSVTVGSSSTLTVTASATIAPGPYTVTVTGVEGNNTHSVSVTVSVTAAPSDFSISANPASLNVVQGNIATSTISTAVVTGTADAIGLTVASSPSGLAATLNPTVVNAGGSSTLTVSPDFSTAPGTYTVTVTGVEGSATHSASVTVTVVIAPSDFTISANPTSLSVVQGSSATSSIATAVIGAPGTVNLLASVSPAGVIAVMNPTSVSAGGSSTLTVSAAYGTPAGSYTVTVTGTEGSTTHSTSVAVTVALKGIVNGGLETGDFTGWTVTGKTAVVKTPHAGKFAARVGSTSPSTNSTLAQTFSVPAAGGKLSFWYRMMCQDTLANDWFTVTLHDNSTGSTSTLRTRVCSTTGWTHVIANVSAHAGHSVTLTFLNHDDNQLGDASFTLVDDVTLT